MNTNFSFVTLNMLADGYAQTAIKKKWLKGIDPEILGKMVGKNGKSGTLSSKQCEKRYKLLCSCVSNAGVNKSTKKVDRLAVIGLQEVDATARKIANDYFGKLGYLSIYHKHGGKPDGVMLFYDSTRFKCTTQNKLKGPDTYNTYNKYSKKRNWNSIVATLKDKNTKITYGVGVTHLEGGHVKSSGIQNGLKQAEGFRKALDSTNADVMIGMGDFNDEVKNTYKQSKTKVDQFINNGYNPVLLSGKNKFKGTELKSGRQLDHGMWKAQKGQNISLKVELATNSIGDGHEFCSDHLPLMAEFKVTAVKKGPLKKSPMKKSPVANKDLLDLDLTKIKPNSGRFGYNFAHGTDEVVSVKKVKPKPKIVVQPKPEIVVKPKKKTVVRPTNTEPKTVAKKPKIVAKKPKKKSKLSCWQKIRNAVSNFFSWISSCFIKKKNYSV